MILVPQFAIVAAVCLALERTTIPEVNRAPKDDATHGATQPSVKSSQKMRRYIFDFR